MLCGCYASALISSFAPHPQLRGIKQRFAKPNRKTKMTCVGQFADWEWENREDLRREEFQGKKKIC